MDNEKDEDIDILDQLQNGIRILEAQGPMYEKALEELAELDDYLQGKSPAEVHEDAPLKLEDAICLPELRGYFSVDPVLRTPSESLSIKTLRKAISDGQLAVLRPNTKNLYVTRRAVKEWLASCLDQGNQPISSSARIDTTRAVGSRTTPSISSKTATSRLALDAAEMTLSALKNSSTTTSRKSTRTKS
ncbi:hypothetical protein ABE562_04755 [Brucella intermedia]|uniref:Uncharacterized protein n=1 Tax=Brucella intermedia GD04153 TaxID=2975438 RepID=A0AA42GVY5_9HYPH|nr:hypothetical protein [Brucella intermedia]MDH0123275.1 hypothetical protein [Brucella intermedia GD04153]